MGKKFGQRGSGAVEYGLMVGLVGVATLTATTQIGHSVSCLFEGVALVMQNKPFGCMPDFMFDPTPNVVPNTVVTSNTVMLTDFANPVTLTVGGTADLFVNGELTVPPVTVPKNTSVFLRTQASPLSEMAKTVALFAGDTRRDWVVTTGDQTPIMTVADKLNQGPNQPVESDAFAVSDFTIPLLVSVSGTPVSAGAVVSIDGGASWSAGPVTLNPPAVGSPWPTMKLRMWSPATEDGTSEHVASLQVGETPLTWTVKTRDALADRIVFEDPVDPLPLMTPHVVQGTIEGVSSAASVLVESTVPDDLTATPTLATLEASADGVTWQMGILSGNTWTVGPMLLTPDPVEEKATLYVRVMTPKTEGATRTVLVSSGTVADDFTVTAGDATPDTFTIADAVPGAAGYPALSALATTPVVSETVTLAGMSVDSPLVVTQAEGVLVEMQVNGGTWGPPPATLPANASFALRMLAAPGTTGAVRQAQVSVGGQTPVVWRVISPDPIPDVFTITALTGQPLNSVVESEAVTVTGINTPITLTVAATVGDVALPAPVPTLSVEGGTPAATVTVENGQQVIVRMTTPNVSVTERTVLVSIAGVATPVPFKATTQGNDSVPEDLPATLTPLTEQEPLVVVLSPEITLNAFDAPAVVTVQEAGVEALLNGGQTIVTSSASGTLYPEQTVQLRVTTGDYGASKIVHFSVGGRSSAWTVGTRAKDDAPDAATLVFASLTAQQGSSWVESAAITPKVYKDAATVTVAGDSSARVSIAGGAWVSSGTITPGQTLKIGLTSGIPDGVTSTAWAVVGGVQVDENKRWTVKTVDSTPTWTVTNPTNATQQTWATSGFFLPENYDTPTTIQLLSNGWSFHAYYHDGDESRQTSFYVGQTVVLKPGRHIVFYMMTPTTTSTEMTATYKIGNEQRTWTATSAATDTIPTGFVFNDVASATAGAEVMSNVITPVGYLTPTTVTMGGTGAFRINGGAWVTTGTISPGQTLQLKATAPNGMWVYVGGVADYWSVSTAVPDSEPDTCGPIANVTGHAPATWFGYGIPLGAYNVKSTLKVSAVVAGAGGSVSFCNNVDCYAAGTYDIYPDQGYAIGGSSSSSFGGVVTVTYQCGTTKTGSFTVTTRAAQVTPDTFTFTNLSGQSGNTDVFSNTLPIKGAGFNDAATVSLLSGSDSSARVSINGGAWVTGGTMTAGQSLRLKVTTGDPDATTKTVKVQVGTVSTTWTVSTVDTMPNTDNLVFAAKTGAEPATLVNSGSAITLGGFTSPTPVSVSATLGTASVQLRGGGLVASGTANAGDTLRLYVTAPPHDQTTRVTANIGGRTATWDVTSRSMDTVPSTFSIAAKSSQPLSTLIESAVAKPSGYKDAATITLTPTPAGTTAQSFVSSDNGATWVESDTIVPGQKLMVKLMSASTPATQTSVKVDVGGMGSAAPVFKVTTGAGS